MWPFRRREAKTNSLDVMRAYFLGQESSTGQRVTTQRALGVTTVLRCATLLGNGCQQIPFKLYLSEDEGATRQVVKPGDNAVAKVLTRRPNGWMTPGAFRRTMTMHASLAPFALAIKVVNARGELLELLPCNPSWVSWKQRDDWTIEYKIAWPSGQSDTFEQGEVFVLRGPSWDAVEGLGAVKYAREAIGLRLAVDESQGRFFRNGMRTQGFLASKSVPDEDQRKRLVATWAEAYGGSANAGKTPLLEGDLEYKPMDVKNTDAETMALRGQQIEEICRAFGVFPQMVGYSGDKTPTFASAEQFFMQHVVHTLQPWHVEWEEAAASQLLSDDEIDGGYYFKFTVQALLRGTAADRAAFLEKMVRMSAMSPNEVRALEEYDAEPELNRFQIPANTTVLQDDGTPAPTAIKPTEQVTPPTGA